MHLQIHRAIVTCFVVASVTLIGCRSYSSSSGLPPLIAVSNMLHPPFSSLDDEGRAVGIEVEIVAEAARRMGREVRWVERPFGELLDAVVSGEADIAASTIGITPERAELVTFSAPYYRTQIVAMTRGGDGEPRTLDDLAGRRVATDRGTTAVPAAEARIPAAVRVLERDEGRTWAEMLSAGDVDAIILDRSHVEEFSRAAGTRFATIDEPLREELFGFATRHDAEKLHRALNDAIAARPQG